MRIRADALTSTVAFCDMPRHLFRKLTDRNPDNPVFETAPETPWGTAGSPQEAQRFLDIRATVRFFYRPANRPRRELLENSMKVHEVMTRDVRTCTPHTDMATAAISMWEGDCGILPVVDESLRVVGVITDRDICIAAATKGWAPGEIAVREIAGRTPVTCTPDESAARALEKMGEARIRRLPVVNSDGTLQGIVSIADLIRQAQAVPRKAQSVTGTR